MKCHSLNRFLIVLLAVVVTVSLVSCATIKSIFSFSKPETKVTDEAEAESLNSDEYISYKLHRYALVIGNSTYEEGALGTTADDAKLMADKLSDAGFDVYFYQNLTKSGMDNAFTSFAKVSKKSSSTVVVYYAGHAVAIEGVNYLIPVDNAKIESENDVKANSCSLDDLLSILKAKEQIIILDACRDYPYKKSGEEAKEVKGGLAELKEAQKGVALSYLFAAQIGQTAKDGEGANSLFTMVLAEEIEKGNAPAGKLFAKVAARVSAMTDGEQVPLSSDTDSDFVFQSEELSAQVSAKWVEQLGKAAAELNKLESKGTATEDYAVALSASQAKVAFAQAKMEAAGKRAAKLKADAEKAALEAESAKARSAELQAKIDALQIAVENALINVRINSVAESPIVDAIDDIEGYKAKIIDIYNQAERLAQQKIFELSPECYQATKAIEDASYQSGELDSSDNPTESALSARQLRMNEKKAEYDAEFAEFIAETTAKMHESEAELLEIIKAKAEALENTEFNLSSLTGGLVISITKYDRDRGGWELSLDAGSLFSEKVFLSYEVVTGKKMVPAVTDQSQLSEYQEYLDNIDMFDSMFSRDIPVIAAEVKCRVNTGKGSLIYQIVLGSLVVKRTDTGATIYEMDAREFGKRQGNLMISSSTGLDVRSTYEIKTSTLDSSLVGVQGVAGGWIFYDKGEYSDGWRFLEAAPEDLDELYEWGEDGEFETSTAVGTGKANTELVVSMSTGKKPNAFKACADYSANRYDDWFLPSKDELKLVFDNLQKNGLGDFSNEDYYWSSSGGEPEYAWSQYFGMEKYDERCNRNRVRPVRAF